MSPGPPPPAKSRRHLMGPGQVRPQVAPQDAMSLRSVQRWVLSTLVAITVLHLSGGLVVAAYFSTAPASRIGLLVIAAVFGMLAFVAALLIHGRSPVSWLPLVGLLPAAVGAYLMFLA